MGPSRRTRRRSSSKCPLLITSSDHFFRKPPWGAEVVGYRPSPPHSHVRMVIVTQGSQGPCVCDTELLHDALIPRVGFWNTVSSRAIVCVRRNFRIKRVAMEHKQ